jgi:hypothetical protein
MSPRRASASLLWLTFVALLAACAQVPANNPYDPETPVVRQAQGAVIGRLTLPGGFDTALFESSSVELTGEGRETTVGVTREGAFSFDPVAAGVYVLTASVPGLVSPQRVVRVELGARLDVGNFPLRPDLTGTNRGAIIGQARRAGAADDGHGDIRVEAVGTPYSTQTASDGQFQLEVPATTYTVRFATPGYASPPDVMVEVGPGQVVELAEPALLVGEPATIRGVVQLYADAAGAPVSGAAALLPNADVRLSRLGEPEPLQIERPGEDGVFVLSNVAPGAYEVSASLAGFGGVRVVAEARAGETSTVALALVQSRGAISGRVARIDRPGAGEVTVVLTGKASEPAVAGLRLAARTTPGDDRFLLEGVPTGTWEVTATADGYRTPPAVDVPVSAEVAGTFDATLNRRLTRMHLPAASTGRVVAQFDRDADLTHVQVWLDSPDPPQGATFVALDGADLDEAVVETNVEGAHVVYARLANREGAENSGMAGLYGVVTETLSGQVLIDRTAPEAATLVTIDGNRFVRRADGLVELIAVCSDALTPQDALRLRIVRAGPRAEALYDGPPLGLVRVRVGPAEGALTLVATCSDIAGESALSEPLDLVYDTTPPSVAALTVGSGRPDAATRERLVTVAVDARDALSGLDAFALAEGAALDCANAAYVYAPAPSVPFTLEDRPGARPLSLCARDRAGNISARFESNPIAFDDVAPSAPTLVVADGADWTRARSVTLRVDNVEAGALVELDGDLEERGRYGVGLPRLPARITLPDVDGPHVVIARAVDAAGNTSEAATQLVALDRVAPAAGRLSVADGAAFVNTRTLAVSIADTAADGMLVWETPAAAACEARACDHPTRVPFAPNSTFTLSEGTGPKRLCWRVCDAAGNATPVAAVDVELRTYIPRPTPVLDALSQRSVRAFSDEASGPLEVIGRGFAFDARVQIGQFEVPCEGVEPPAVSCQADDDGACALGGGRCDATCGTTCRFRLPEPLRGQAGTYPVWVITPEPTADGQGRSSGVQFLDVVAPVPRITRLSQWGVTQSVSNGAPTAQMLDLEVVGDDLLDNTQFRLGGNSARVQSIRRDPSAPVRGAVFQVQVSTANLVPSDLDDVPFVAVSPSPGGGESAPVRFGINPEVTPCPPAAPCASNLRRSRAPILGTSIRAQNYDIGRWERPFAVGWQGTRVARALSKDTLTMLGGAETSTMGGLLAATVDDIDGARLESPDGEGPTTTLYAAASRNTGAFGDGDAAIASDFGERPGDIAVADLNQDGFVDVVAANAASEGMTIALGRGDGSFEPTSTVLTPGFIFGAFVALGDLNSDGSPDIVVSGSRPDDVPIAVFLNRGDGTFSDSQLLAPTLVSLGNIERVRLGDADGDGDTDIVTKQVLSDGATTIIHVIRGDGAGNLETASSLFSPAPLDDFALQDMNRDGQLDLVGVDGQQRALYVLPGVLACEDPSDPTCNQPTRPTFGAPERTTLPNVNWRWEGLELGDVDLNGAVDVVLRDRFGHAVVALNAGSGPLTPTEIAPPGDVGNTFGMSIADLDGDGWPDLVFSAQANRVGETLIADGLGDGRFSPWRRLAGRAVGATVHPFDVDLDGTLDIVHRSASGVIVELGVGGRDAIGTRQEFATVPAPLAVDNPNLASSGLHWGDLDGDGHDELVVVSTDGTVSSFGASQLGDGTGSLTLWGGGYLPGGIDVVASAVVDTRGDARAEALTVSRTGELRSTEHGESGFSGAFLLRQLIAQGGLNAAFIATGRLNADARDDVALAYVAQDDNLVSRATLVVMMRTDQGLSAPSTVTLPTIPGATDSAGLTGLAIGDINGDGRNDLLWTYSGANPLPMDEAPLAGYRLGRGNGLFDPARLVFGPHDGGPRGAVLNDFDGDGRDDLVTCEAGIGRARIWRSEVDGTFQARPVVMDRGCVDLRSADANGDGATDLFIVDSERDELRLAVNDGEGSLTLGTSIRTLPDQNIVATMVSRRLGRALVATASTIDTVLTTWALPTASGWAQTFTPEPGSGALTARQSMQNVDALSVRIRLEGAALSGVSLSLRAPNGDVARLRDAASPAIVGEVAQLHFTAGQPGNSLSDLLGWQPNGEWSLVVEPANGVTVRDFAVVTHGFPYDHTPSP